MLAGNNCIKTEGKGTLRIVVDGFEITLVDVLYVPGLQCNFFSVAREVHFDYTVKFNKNFREVRKEHEKVTLCANKIRDLYLCEIETKKLFFTRKQTDEARKWHHRYGHMNFGNLRALTNR